MKDQVSVPVESGTVSGERLRFVLQAAEEFVREIVHGRSTATVQRDKLVELHTALLEVLRAPTVSPATPSVTVEEVQAVIEAGRALLDRYSVKLTGYGGLALGDPPSSDCYEEWERFYNAHKRLSLPRAPAKETTP